MTVKELRVKLEEYNPEAEVWTIVAGKTYPFSLTFGDREGESKKTCRRIGIYIEGLNQSEETEGR